MWGMFYKREKSTPKGVLFSKFKGEEVWSKKPDRFPLFGEELLDLICKQMGLKNTCHVAIV